MNEDLMNKILKSLFDGEQPKQRDFEVSQDVWDKTASFLKSEGYIKNITISHNTKYMLAELTEKGRNYVK